MPKSKIVYDPTLSVSENARRSGVSESAIRYYIKTNSIDRRYDKKVIIVEDCRKYLRNHPTASKNEIARATGYSHSTVGQYWEYISTEKELTIIDSVKKQNRQLRQANNYYASHPSITKDLLNVEAFSKDILEPFCGGGTMAKVIAESGYSVDAYDIVDRGYGKVGDFFSLDIVPNKFDIITNPPYDDKLGAIMLRCYELCRNKVALLLPLRYLSGLARYDDVYSQCPPSRIYVYSNRVPIAKNGDFVKYPDAGANKEIYAWFIWDKAYRENTELRWLKNTR